MLWMRFEELFVVAGLYRWQPGGQTQIHKMTLFFLIVGRVNNEKLRIDDEDE